MKTKVGPGKWRAYGLVRDKHGKPKIDDKKKIPGPIWDMLSKTEQEEIEHGNNDTPDGNP